MNKYIKPSFMFVALETTTSAGASCALTADDKVVLEGWYGPDWASKGFESGISSCTIPIENYCKFTSNATQAFFS